MTDPTYVPERRPIATRERASSKRLASWLIRRHVSANAVSVAGMFCGVAAGAAMGVTTRPGWRIGGFLLAAALIQLRLLANMLDGMVAVGSQKASRVGELYNEIPDRVADAAILIGAGYAVSGQPVIGCLAACVAIFTAYIRAEGSVAGAPQQFCGPMAKPQRMFLMTVAALYAALAPQWLQPVLPGIAGRGPITVALLLVIVGGVVTSIRRLRRIAASLDGSAA